MAPKCQNETDLDLDSIQGNHNYVTTVVRFLETLHVYRPQQTMSFAFFCQGLNQCWEVFTRNKKSSEHGLPRNMSDLLMLFFVTYKKF